MTLDLGRGRDVPRGEWNFIRKTLFIFNAGTALVSLFGVGGGLGTGVGV
jgi:hypothetical protein